MCMQLWPPTAVISFAQWKLKWLQIKVYIQYFSLVRSIPKVPFLSISLLRNQMETLATQAIFLKPTIFPQPDISTESNNGHEDPCYWKAIKVIYNR